MIRLNIHEAKTHLSEYLARLEKGETIILCKRNVPIAEIRPIKARVRGKRPIGLAKGKLRIHKSFFDPLSDELIDAFEGHPTPVKLLLDTCTFLWVAEGSTRLSSSAIEYFEDFENEAYLSVVSAWEIAVKNSIGTVSLNSPPDQFVPKYRAAYGIETLALTEEAALHLGGLPKRHRDPFDRMLICQAIMEGIAILTPDELIRQYPVRAIW
jgi:PIN domain nuclease of toxin-antitoxin system/antitoxin (DNA-binding transcriptional repressor) of toxin-antitoxin stability system